MYAESQIAAPDAIRHSCFDGRDASNNSKDCLTAKVRSPYQKNNNHEAHKTSGRPHLGMRSRWSAPAQQRIGQSRQASGKWIWYRIGKGRANDVAWARLWRLQEA